MRALKSEKLVAQLAMSSYIDPRTLSLSQHYAFNMSLILRSDLSQSILENLSRVIDRMVIPCLSHIEHG